MPDFDLSSAQPVNIPMTFDIESAQPVYMNYAPSIVNQDVITGMPNTGAPTPEEIMTMPTDGINIQLGNGTAALSGQTGATYLDAQYPIADVAGGKLSGQAGISADKDGYIGVNYQKQF